MSPTEKHQNRWRTLAVLSLSLVVIGLGNTVLNVALPSLQEDLSISGSTLQWVVDAYMLVFAGCRVAMLLAAGVALAGALLVRRHLPDARRHQTAAVVEIRVDDREAEAAVA